MQRRKLNVSGDDMTMTDVALWIIFAALIVIVPVGCILTRPAKK
jgi:hypothetical protein